MLNIAGIVLIIIILFFLICFLRSQSLDTFISLIDDIIPSNCYNYLVSNGYKFFLINTKKVIDGVTNPLAFNTKNEALQFLTNNNCTTELPFVDLVTHKKIEDPTVSYERECNKQLAPQLFDLDVCNKYGPDDDIKTIEYNKQLKELKKLKRDTNHKTGKNIKNIFNDYKTETCMMDKIMKDNTDLDDIHFKSYFAKYFDNLNSNIDEKYLYI